jgi:hypothetical protein
MPPQFLELGLLLVLILLVSAGIVLWMQSQKKRLHPLVQVFALILLVTLLLVGLKYGSNSMGLQASSTELNDFRKALVMLNENYPTYTTTNNLNGVSREVLLKRFEDMEKLELAEIKPQVTEMRGLILEAPSSGQPGIYNMRMTSEIQARWSELREALQKRAQ